MSAQKKKKKKNKERKHTHTHKGNNKMAHGGTVNGFTYLDRFRFHIRSKLTWRNKTTTTKKKKKKTMLQTIG